MQITKLSPMPVALPGGGVVAIAVERWDLDRWAGPLDGPEVGQSWARKPGFAVGGRRSCAELAIVDHMRGDGWDGVWVDPYLRELRSEWFPAPAAKTLAELGAPGWAVTEFDRLMAANGDRLAGFFDVFAWRKPGEFRFAEAKVGTDPLGDNQRAFLEMALRYHPPGQFVIIKVPAQRRRAKTTAPKRTFRVDEMEEPVTELLLAGNKALDTRSPLHPLAMWLRSCDDCGVPKGEPCVPHEGSSREERGSRNHYSHMSRRKATAEHLSSLLCRHIVQEAEQRPQGQADAD